MDCLKMECASSMVTELDLVNEWTQEISLAQDLLVAEPLEIGEWTYNPTCDQWDLSRGSPQTMTLPCDSQTYNHSGCRISPSATALVIVDMQNYFINATYNAHPAGLKAVKPLIKVIERCRANGIQIIWLNWVIDELELARTPPSVLRAFDPRHKAKRGHGWGVNLGSKLPNGERVLFEGTHNADIYGPLKAAADVDRDIFCRKSRMSGMWSPAEEMQIFLGSPEGNHIKTLMFAGVNTDQCLLSTLTDAQAYGWDCVLLSDCTGTATPIEGAQRVSEGNIATNSGFVVTSAAFVDAKVMFRRDSAIMMEHDVGTEEIFEDASADCNVEVADPIHMKDDYVNEEKKFILHRGDSGFFESSSLDMSAWSLVQPTELETSLAIVAS